MKDFYFPNQPVDDFEGITPAQMHGLLYTPFDRKLSPLRLNEGIDNRIIWELKFYRHFMQFLQKIDELQPLKLTQKGNLPQKLLQELCDLDIFESEKERDLIKQFSIRRETDNFYIHIIHILSDMMRLTIKKRGKILLTRDGRRFLDKELARDFYLRLFINYTSRYNWEYGDLYPGSWIIQAGFGFSIYLVQKYGNEPRGVNFYAEKFLKAFSKAMNDFPCTKYLSGLEDFQSCYGLRTFKRFMKKFGFIEILNEDEWDKDQKIIKKDLVDNFVKWDFTIRDHSFISNLFSSN